MMAYGHTHQCTIDDPTTMARANTITTAQNIGTPALTTIPAKKMEVMPMMEVIDISMLAMRITKTHQSDD
jgi:hypothetical protein